MLAAAIALSSVPVFAQQPAGVSAAEPLQEIIVTGSRIAAPNEQSTSPIQVISSKSIQVSGKTDITDLINQLPQNFTNDLGQDLGNGTSGLSTAGGVATADLRGIGPQRTLVLVDGRRLGVGSPQTSIQSPAPDLDQTRAERRSGDRRKANRASMVPGRQRGRQLHHEEKLRRISG